MPGPVLEGLRVLDLSWGIAGPMATMLLADHGAAVTRIEPPGGDPFRTQLGYRTWQRGKKSAVLDLANTIMKTVGRLYKVLPTALVAAAMRPSITRTTVIESKFTV